MIGRTPDNIVAVRPMKEDGVMVKYFIRQLRNKSVFAVKPCVIVCVPITAVENHTVLDATLHVGARVA